MLRSSIAPLELILRAIAASRLWLLQASTAPGEESHNCTCSDCGSDAHL